MNQGEAGERRPDAAGEPEPGEYPGDDRDTGEFPLVPAHRMANGWPVAIGSVSVPDALRRVAADLAFRDQRLPGRAGLEITCRPRPDNCLSPGSVVTVRVRTSADLPLMPAIFGDEAPSIAVSSEHSAPYGTFRDDR